MPRVHVPTPDQGSEPVRMAMAATREWATDSPTTEAQPSPPPQPPSQATSTAPPAQVPGDPSPEGDSNIDGFTRTEDVVAEMRAGQVTARTGREFRFPAPRLGHAGVFEVGRVRDRLVLEISINREGNVEHVQITTSSGSDYVDHAYRTAAYKGWFQPRPERAGKAGETFEFTVRFVS
jgi:TonB family protein